MGFIGELVLSAAIFVPGLFLVSFFGLIGVVMLLERLVK